MAKQPIPIREVVLRSKRSRTAVYKAILTDRLTKTFLFGVTAVVDDRKLAEFIEAGQLDDAAKRNGTKRVK